MTTCQNASKELSGICQGVGKMLRSCLGVVKDFVKELTHNILKSIQGVVKELSKSYIASHSSPACREGLQLIIPNLGRASKPLYFAVFQLSERVGSSSFQTWSWNTVKYNGFEARPKFEMTNCRPSLKAGTLQNTMVSKRAPSLE
jgi:hypothetical protein